MFGSVLVLKHNGVSVSGVTSSLKGEVISHGWGGISGILGKCSSKDMTKGEVTSHGSTGIAGIFDKSSAKDNKCDNVS